MFLGSVAGSLYIFFILTSGMLRSPDIYIIRVPTCNCNNEFILSFILRDKRWAISNANNY